MAQFDLFLFDGHGDGDCGAVSNGKQEHTEAKKFNDKVCEYLKPTGLKIHRGVNNYKNNLLAGNTYTYKFGFSTHLNSASNTIAGGIEILAQGKEKYLEVEEAILKRIVNKTGLTNRGIKSRCYDTEKWYGRSNGTAVNITDYFKELRDARTRGLSLSILELAFISNKDDMAKWDKYIDDMALIVADEIAKYCGKSINTQQTTTKVPTASSDVFYRVIAGSYKDISNATNQQKKLKQAGFDSFLEAFKK